MNILISPHPHQCLYFSFLSHIILAIKRYHLVGLIYNFVLTAMYLFMGLQAIYVSPLYVCRWMIHVDVWQKPTQFCKAIIFQLKNLKFLKSESVNCSLCPPLATPWTIAHQVPLSMGISQATILERIAIPFSRGSPRPRDRTQVSCIVGRSFTVQATREAHVSWRNIYSSLFPIF